MVEGDQGFESPFLQQRVRCELHLRPQGDIADWRLRLAKGHSYIFGQVIPMPQTDQSPLRFRRLERESDNVARSAAPVL